MNRCLGTVPQKRPDPGHSRNSLGSGGRRPGATGKITGIIIGLVMMESRMMQDRLAQKIRTRRVWKQRARQRARLAAVAGALGLIALAGMAGGVAQAQDSPDSGLWGSMMKTLGIGGENN